MKNVLKKKKTPHGTSANARTRGSAETESHCTSVRVRQMINGGPRSRNLFALPLDGEPNGDQHAYFYPWRSHTSQPKRCPGAMG